METFALPGLWLSQENVLKGRSIMAAKGIARRVIIITAEFELGKEGSETWWARDSERWNDP